MKDKLLNLVNSAFPIEERDVKEFKIVKKFPFRFDVSAYEIKDVGNMSYMKMKAMGGLMKMDSLIITPFYKDMPLLSFDVISIGNKLIVLLEMYDTRINKDVNFDTITNIKNKYSYLKDEKVEPNWYDSIKLPQSLKRSASKKQLADINNLVSEYVSEYLNIVNASKSCDKNEKQIHNKKYSDGLLNNGGPSTDVFIKLFGKEKTEELFGNYLFGTLL